MPVLHLTSSEVESLLITLDVCTDRLPLLRESEIDPQKEKLWRVYKRLLRLKNEKNK